MTTSTHVEWQTVEEFRKRHGLGKNLVYEAVRRGRLKSLKIGGKILIATDALDHLADAQSSHRK